VLAKLDSKQQAILLGHAVPMPVVIKTRDYGTAASYAELTRGRIAIRRAPLPDDEPAPSAANGTNGHEPDPAKALKEIEELFER
jgi:hypothetical protein